MKKEKREDERVFEFDAAFILNTIIFRLPTCTFEKTYLRKCPPPERFYPVHPTFQPKPPFDPTCIDYSVTKSFTAFTNVQAGSLNLILIKINGASITSIH